MSEDLTKKLPANDSEKLTLILDRLDRVEETLEQRLYDTRPIWQKAVGDIAQLQGTVGQLQGTVVELQGTVVQLQGTVVHLQGTVDQVQKTQERVLSDCEEIKMSVRDIYGSFEVLTEAIVSTQVRHRDVERRVKALEANTNPPNTET